MRQQVVGAAVDGLGGHDMLAGLGQGLEGVGDGRCAGGHRQGRGAVLQRGNAGLEHALGGVGQAAVDVARIPQAETVSGVLAVMEHIGGGGVNGHGAGVGDRVSLLLTDVQLFGFKGPVGGIPDIRHGDDLLLL